MPTKIFSLNPTGTYIPNRIVTIRKTTNFNFISAPCDTRALPLKNCHTNKSRRPNNKYHHKYE